jgi:hypothetical protein
VHQNSELHPLIQLADLVAGAGWRAIAKRKPYAGWYDRHLRQHATGMNRDIDLGTRALAQIKRRSRRDACGSGWPGALLP